MFAKNSFLAVFSLFAFTSSALAARIPAMDAAARSITADNHVQMTPRSTGKRVLLWDYTNTQSVPWAMNNVYFGGPISAVANWNAWTPDELKGRAPFRPTIHGISQLSGTDWDTISNTDQPIIYGFIEPERQGISAKEAADYWFNQTAPLRLKGKKLVGPSTASDGPGQAWQADFMSRVASNPPDYQGLTYYGTDGGEAIQYLETMHEQYNLPIVVTEIASTSRTYNDVVGFTEQVTNFMDTTGWIVEYGWFGCMTHVPDDFVSPEAQLMNPDGSFTDLMFKLMYDQPMKS